MSGFDYLVFLVVGLAAIMGFFRGFVEEVLALAAWCVALMAVHYGHALVSDMLTAYVHNDTGAEVLAFALLLALPYLAIKLIASSIGSASRNSVLGPIDRVLGFGFGALKGFVVTVLAFSLLVLVYDVVWGAKGRPAWIKDARTYPFLNAASAELLSMVAARRNDAVKADENTADDPTEIEPTHAPRRHHHHPATE